MTLTIYTNNQISINDRFVGRIKALTKMGQEQNPTGSRQQTRTVFYLQNSEPGIVIDAPAYIPNQNKTGCIINPALEDMISECLRKE